MIVKINPSRLQGNIQAPASKSSMQRACAAALLLTGTTVIHNPGHSNDDNAAIGIIQALGAEISSKGDDLIITSEGFPFTNHQSPTNIQCGESGLSIRMFTPLVSLSDKRVIINGSGSLVSRPMNFFDEILPKLQVKINSRDGRLPLDIQGPLRPADIEVDGSLSSQFLTGLLMAYGASGSHLFFTGNGEIASSVSIRVNNLKSRPYIDLTLDVMNKFGFNVPENRNYEEFIFSYKNAIETPDKAPGQENVIKAVNTGSLTQVSYTVEGDWSGAAFLLVAGAIAGPISLSGLDLTSTQADKAIINALMSANAGIAIEAKGIRIHPVEMNSFEFDATDCPDLFPPLVALAAYCKGDTKIQGVSRLYHKESNRALTLQDEFDKMGVTIDLDGDNMIIHGNNSVKGADVHSHHDHRIAMACAVAGLKADSEMIIEEAQAVEKSYPDFYEDLQKLGADVSLNNKLTWHE